MELVGEVERRISGLFSRGLSVADQRTMLFLDHPLISAKLAGRIRNSYSRSLSETGRQEVQNEFGKFIFNPGLLREDWIDDRAFAQIKKAAPGIKTEYRKINSAKVHSSLVLIRESKKRIREGRNIAYDNIDLGKLRKADNVGFAVAEKVLRIFVVE